MWFNLFLSCTLGWSQWINLFLVERWTDGTNPEYVEWIIHLGLNSDASSFVAKENKERPASNKEVCSMAFVSVLTCRRREMMKHFLANFRANNEPLSLFTIRERCSMQGLHWHSIDCVSVKYDELKTWHKLKSMTHLQISSSATRWSWV